MAPTVPTVTLSSGHKMPVFGLGTWKSKPGEVTEAVKAAIEAGYTHIDCAFVYGNEPEVGAALKQKMADGVKREDLFITSKLWNTFHSPAAVEPALKKTLEGLGLEYLDMYLIHWPMGYQEGGSLFPKDDKDNWMFSDVDYVDTWKAMEACVQKGLVRSIGVSNFNEAQCDRVQAVATVPISTNQVECHPYLNQKKLMEYSKAKNIAVTAYSPLGSPDRPWAKPGDPQLLEDPKLKELAARYNKSPAQVVIRWQIQRGNIVIPKSVTASRIQQNIDVFDFSLTDDDMAYLDTFHCQGRVCGLDWIVHHPHHPFKEEMSQTNGAN